MSARTARSARHVAGRIAGKCGKWLGLFVLGVLVLIAWVMVCMYLGFTLGQHVSKWFG